MTPIVLRVIQGVSAVWNGERLTFLCALQIDGDGSGLNLEGDPDFQDDTSLHYGDTTPDYSDKTKALNSRKVPFFVFPPQLIRAVPQVVLGSGGTATNINTNASSPLVVGDVGPDDKLGEGSICLASRLGVDPNPLTGGTNDRIIRVEIYPGVPAVVDGITYALRKYGG